MFGWVIIYEALPQKLAALITSITSDPLLFLLIVNLVLLFVGMVIDGIAAIILISPILLPIAMNDFNISPYQFGVVMCLNLTLGLLTPPVGVGASSMSGVSAGRILKSLWPFLLAVTIILVLLSAFPWISNFMAK
ncbi:TRAP transporter large permease subunit [Thalassospira sp. SM2505]